MAKKGKKKGPQPWSNARLKTYRRCPNQYRMRYILGLKKKRKELPLFRGDWLHQLLEVHYTGGDWEERQASLEAEFFRLFEEEREELGDLPTETRRIFTSYLMRWAREDKGMTVIDAEIDEEVELPNGEKFRLIIDLLVEEHGSGLWIWDHKTVGKFMPSNFMLIDSQLARYFWGAKQMGYNVRGILFNELITKPPTVPETLKSGRLTQRRNLRCDVYTYYRTIKELGQEPGSYKDMLLHLKSQQDEWFRRTRLPKDPALTQRTVAEMLMTIGEIHRATKDGHFPRTPMKSCVWDCAFADPCMIELMGGDISDVVKSRYTTADERAKEAKSVY